MNHSQVKNVITFMIVNVVCDYTISSKAYLLSYLLIAFLMIKCICVESYTNMILYIFIHAPTHGRDRTHAYCYVKSTHEFSPC